MFRKEGEKLSSFKVKGRQINQSDFLRNERFKRRIGGVKFRRPSRNRVKKHRRYRVSNSVAFEFNDPEQRIQNPLVRDNYMHLSFAFYRRWNESSNGLGSLCRIFLTASTGPCLFYAFP